MWEGLKNSLGLVKRHQAAAAAAPASPSKRASAGNAAATAAAAAPASPRTSSFRRSGRSGRQSLASASVVKTAGSGDGLAPSTIVVRPWDASTPYLQAMSQISNTRALTTADPAQSDEERRMLLEQSQQIYDVYIDFRDRYVNSPSFYLDVADFLLRMGPLFHRLGARVLTNLAELGLHEPRLLRSHEPRRAAWRLADLWERHAGRPPTAFSSSRTTSALAADGTRGRARQACRRKTPTASSSKSKPTTWCAHQHHPVRPSNGCKGY